MALERKLTHRLSLASPTNYRQLSYRDKAVVIDNFVEVDRGYSSCWGLVDRLYNPKDGSRVIATLNTLLPQQIRSLTSLDTTNSRVLAAESDDGSVLLVSENGSRTTSGVNAQFSDEIAAKRGTLIDLVTGDASTTTLREVIANRDNEEARKYPALLLLKD